MQQEDYELVFSGNFYECISHALEGRFKPKAVHDKLLMQFARTMFFNIGSCETIAQVLNIPSQTLVLNAACYKHPAIKVWIERVHEAEPCLHKSASDWYKIYPKILKGLALRFLHYHLSYKKKPHRCVCRIAFSHLVAEVFCCRVGFIMPKTKWIYPLDSDDYYIGMDITTIVLKYVDPGQFESFKPKSLLVSELRLLPEKDALESEDADLFILPDMDAPSFMLRKYIVESLQQQQQQASKAHSNVQVGMFKSISAHTHVMYYMPLATTEEVMYQIYPGNEEKTFYTIPAGCSLFVFRAVGKPGTDLLQATLVAHTDSHDQYLYFYLPMDTRAVIVVCAKNTKEAESTLLGQSTFVLNEIK